MDGRTIREQTEEFEKITLSPFAAYSMNTRGRLRAEDRDEIRTEYQRDRDRIIHSKAFRRLKQKTQVFLLPEGDHYRTRMTHTLEVSQISRTIARALRLNEDLTEAIALGHDLGHAPFGHAGEMVLNRIYPKGFKHNEQSLHVVDFLENDGKGLNLTWEVRDGILNHTGKGIPVTLEGQIVKTADRIAYLNHDLDDAIRAGVLQLEDLPKEVLKVLGRTHSQRIATLVKDMIVSSMGEAEIKQSAEVFEAMQEFRAFMFKEVYLNKPAKLEEEKGKELVEYVYYYFIQHPDQLKKYNGHICEESPLEEQVKDFVAGMTDRYIVSLFQELTVPKPFASFKGLTKQE
jgi:dGTPase